MAMKRVFVLALALMVIGVGIGGSSAVADPRASATQSVAEGGCDVKTEEIVVGPVTIGSKCIKIGD